MDIKNFTTPCMHNVTTLPCETLTSAKQTIKAKLLGSLATYLRYGGVVNNQIRKVWCLVFLTHNVKVKVKFSHTRYRALGPELIPVYRQSARR